jgi:hypothetical protein
MHTKDKPTAEFLQQHIPVTEAANLTGYTRKTLENWVNSEIGPKRISVKGFSYYNREEFTAFANEIKERDERKYRGEQKRSFAIHLPQHLADFLVRNHKAHFAIEDLVERLYLESKQEAGSGR